MRWVGLMSMAGVILTWGPRSPFAPPWLLTPHNLLDDLSTPSELLLVRSRGGKGTATPSLFFFLLVVLLYLFIFLILFFVFSCIIIVFVFILLLVAAKLVLLNSCGDGGEVGVGLERCCVLVDQLLMHSP